MGHEVIVRIRVSPGADPADAIHRAKLWVRGMIDRCEVVGPEPDRLTIRAFSGATVELVEPVASADLTDPHMGPTP